MTEIVMALALFLSLTPAFAAEGQGEERTESCLVSNLRFDQDMRLYDFVVIEPDYFFLTTVVGYQKVNGEFRPAVGKDQEYRKTEKGFGLKTTYKTDKTLSQRRTDNQQIVFAGQRNAGSYLDSWELTIDLNLRPRILKRVITLKPSGATLSFVCDKGLHTSPNEWFAFPFREEIVEYDVIRPIPTFEPAM